MSCITLQPHSLRTTSPVTPGILEHNNFTESQDDVLSDMENDRRDEASGILR
ncbi:hypothetical protein BD410DRAFT_206488 [Rickenella mellea]|uniref:Uncharacterized protein n=1 Tax=Rickenella mellea TaxID=50990 RepID=A0A4Y7Q6L8_9AGAM|nr:hypothetical protein BD410DRAFT_206488 [Rickenella mellea]